ncbi:MAG TPA: cytochrome c biogenesis protein CcsA [Myxococcota bacterium]|nr:cytochrome c biogenesis protein CcsA [Myxococcota bacterium]
MNSAIFYNLSTAGYVASLAIFAAHVVDARKLFLRLGVLLVAVSFLVQTGGMVLRWVEAGFLEVSAAERAVGHKIFGWSWFVVFSQHPPWSNLYEIMVYMSWGLILVTLGAELKWRLAWVRQMGLLLALLALGLASLTDPSIKPLVPALKSWWIMIHVISASIAYAAGSIAAFICLLALMQDQKRVSLSRLTGFSLMAMAALLAALGGGLRLLTEQAYFVKLLARASDHIIPVLDLTKENNASFLVPMPGMGWLLLLAIFVHIMVALYLLCGPKNNEDIVAHGFLLAFFFTLLCFFVALYHGFRLSPVELEPAVMHHLSPAGPKFLGFKSHPWSFGLLTLALMIEGFIAWFLLKPSSIRLRLPSVENLEGAAYKAIALAFFLMSIVLITGALWAHYAWGRYWAWDPKETGALAIWIIYAIYLHARRTPGLSGPFSSVLGVIGFFVIIVGFLGVNLGLFADGLHTYGNN